MANNKQSLTEGLLIIEMPGRGVSLQREGKSGRKCGHREGKTQFNLTMSNSTEEPPEHTDRRPTVMRAGAEITREIVATPNVCHQIVKIGSAVLESWPHDLRSDEFEYRMSEGKRKKFKIPKYTPEERFFLALQEHFQAICIAGGILPGRCSWKFEPII